MDIYSVVDQRRSVRGFLADPVERDVIERVLSAACRAPSGGNLQPWHLYVLTGDPLLIGRQGLQGDVERRVRVLERLWLNSLWGGGQS